MLVDGNGNGPTQSDKRKVAALARMRRLHYKTLHKDSLKSYRRRQVPTSPAPRLVSAARMYKGMGWLPAALLAPEKLPKEAKLPMKYVVPYYGTSTVGWRLYRRFGVDDKLTWDPDGEWNEAFPKGLIDWGDPSDDRTFVQLRLQGPNPFILRASEGEGQFELDFSKMFDGVFPATVARFEVDTDSHLGLRATSITVGDDTFRPSDADLAGWERSKRAVNALDARYSAFIRHLLNTHLMVGQAFALAAYSLPVWHPLRPFMDFFTYGTMQVNHFAYKSLLTPISYFVQSNFVSAEDARVVINNAMREFDFDEWLAPRDIAARGIDQIPGHPYVADATLIWPAFERVVERFLDDVDITDGEVAEDPHIVAWYATMRRVLPDSETIPSLRNRQDLETLMTALLYNNVIHEVCGNLSPILDSRDHEDKAAVNFEHLRSLVDPDRETETPLAGDVLLMDQASYVSTFNVTGNNMMNVNAARFIDDPRLREAVEELQDTLRELDAQIRARNSDRVIPFKGMQPSSWEASVSF